MKYDNFFETVRKSNKDNCWDAPKPLWLSLAQFDKNKHKTLTGHENPTRNIWDLDPSGPRRRSLQQPSIPMVERSRVCLCFTLSLNYDMIIPKTNFFCLCMTL